MSNKKISFSVKTGEDKQMINEYAIEKGFNNISNLARFALYQYISRYPKKNVKAVPPEALNKDSENSRDNK